MSIVTKAIGHIAGATAKQSVSVAETLATAAGEKAANSMVEAGAKVVTGLVAATGINCGVTAACASVPVIGATLGSFVATAGTIAVPIIATLLVTGANVAYHSHELHQINKLVGNASAEHGEQLVVSGKVVSHQDKVDVHAYMKREADSYAEAGTQIKFIDQKLAVTGATADAATKAEKDALVAEQKTLRTHVEHAMWTAKKGNFLPKQVEVEYKTIISPTVKEAMERQDQKVTVEPAYATRPVTAIKYNAQKLEA